MKKLCPSCKNLKNLNEFHKNRTCKDGHSCYCKKCSNQMAKKKGRVRPLTAEMSRRYAITRHGITVDEYNSRMIEQDYRCAICGMISFDRVLHIDHCHTTNKVRGLLCNNCNSGLGMFRDELNILIAAANYLIKFNEA